MLHSCPVDAAALIVLLFYACLLSKSQGTKIYFVIKKSCDLSLIQIGKDNMQVCDFLVFISC